jgi:hypothetical protein
MLQNIWRWEHYTKQITQALGITQRKYYKSHLRIYKHKETKYSLKPSWRTLATNESTNNVDPTNAPKIRKPNLGVKKPRRNDIEWSNPWRNQATHFVGYTKSLNANNFYNCKNTIATFDVRLTICVSSTNEVKTQVG